ncbi:MAG: tetratricopeptide repeat protein [Alphaproteobacteria bacterium]|nr:tetratricopeptide repeat protein [Alphaproteobacteria bacterium]
MARDASDLTITAADGATARGYDAYVTEFLSYGARLRDLFAVADAAPDAPLINAHAAALHLAFEGAEGWTNARPYLERMRAGSSASERERLFCAAVDAWANKDFHWALGHLDELSVRWPADLCAIKWAQYHAFNLGDQPALLRLARRARIAHEGRPYAHGMIAFALEQNHDLDAAMAEGLRACEIAIDDAWAHHAIAHVHETRGHPEKGARWMARCAHTWDAKGVFIRDHNWWHTALFHLNAGDDAGALAIFDERLWGAWPEFPQEQIGAVSMLWRLEMRGIDVGDRWAPVVSQARARADEHIFPFHDVHYLYALARAGEPGEADAMRNRIGAHAMALNGPAASTWKLALLPAADGAIAFARGDLAAAAAAFAAAEPHLHLIGGSHAQRGLFQEARTFAAAQTSAHRPIDSHHSSTPLTRN